MDTRKSLIIKCNLLVNAKFLLFIVYDEPEVLVSDVLSKAGMRSDDHLDLATLDQSELFFSFPFFLCCLHIA